LWVSSIQGHTWTISKSSECKSDSTLPPLLSGYSWVNWFPLGLVPKQGKWDVLKWRTRITENVPQGEPLMLLPNICLRFVEWSFISTHKLAFKLTTPSLLFTEDAYHLCSNSTLHWHLTKTLPSGRRESQPITSQ